MQDTGFPPLCNENSRVLVLGSMPGRKSLEQGQYYAHHRNAFWWLMQSLFGIDCSLEYEARCEGLLDAGLALWDVCHSCVRPGSLDSRIVEASVKPNDVVSLLLKHPRINVLCFNGRAAEKLFLRHIELPASLRQRLSFYLLPSTSPAHAAMNREEKRHHWQVLQDAVRNNHG